jgi:hypothetical protein
MPVRVGDVIEHDSVLGVVRRFDRQARLAIVQHADAMQVEIEDDLDKAVPERCRVLYNPSQDWPFIKVPDRPRLGLLRGMAIAGVRDLVLFKEWLPTEFGKTGSVFINPDLRIGFGDVLIVHHEKGPARLDVPRTFESAKQRQDKVQAVAREASKPAAYRLLADLDPEDE